MKLQVQPAGVEYAALIAALHAACLSPPWSEATIARLLGGPGGLGWIAALDDQPAGFALIREAADEAEILAIGVLPAERRRGVGRALLTTVIGHCVSHRLSRLYLEVAASNTAAKNAYGRAGFRQVGQRRRYYGAGKTREDALVMRRDLV
ncbi:MAG: ribosomal protein S18-alanine N-acetyltransferase [Pseudomonadota bacterium]